MIIKGTQPQCVQRVYLRVFQCVDKGHPATVCSEGILEGVPMC